MKKSTIAKILMCIMFPSVLMFGGCVGDGDNSGLSIDPKLDEIIQNTQDDPDYYKKFTYTYYNSKGKKISASAFSEAYVFVDPGKDGSYYDYKTGSSVGFAELATRELTTLSSNIAYRLMAVYGDDTVGSSKTIEENIKVIETGETKTSQYKIKLNKTDSIGVFEDADKNTYTSNYVNNIYRFDDMYTLSLLSVNDGSQMSDDTNFAYFSEMFSLKNAISGGGFNVEFNPANTNWFSKDNTNLNSDRQWIINNGGITSIDALSEYIYGKLLSIKTGGSNDIYSIDHLGFTTSQIASIKSIILSDVIGSGNVSYDLAALNNIKTNSSDSVFEQGERVNISEFYGQTMISGSSAFMSALSIFDSEKANNIDAAKESFMSNYAYQMYVNMFGYKAYNVVVDKIVDLALNSNEYDPDDQLINSTTNPLYFLYPRVAVMIVPGIYLGGESEEDDDYLEEDEDEYDFDEIADKSGYDENYEPVTTLEPYLPSWKIISIVYKPDEVYGINNVTEERIDGVVVSDIDIAFVGEEGYTSIIESSVSYVAKGNQVLSGNTARVQDVLVDDICPDMSSSSYPDNHYLTLFDITKTEKDQLTNYVLGKYNGFDFTEEAKNANSGLSIYRVGTADSTVYYNRVDGLPYSSSFMKYVEDGDGNLNLDMSTCLGTNYVKIDVNFLQIEDEQGNDVLDMVKRTNLGIISIEPQTAS